MHTVLSIAIDSVAYGMALFVICVGLSLAMGLMRVINLAHGAFAMLAGYMASFARESWGIGYGEALALAVAGTVVLAILLEQLLYRRIYSRPQLVQILMTIGITFCVVGVINVVFGPAMKTISLPAGLARPVDLGFRTIPAHRLFIIGCGLAVAGGLWVFIARTKLGMQLRATIDDGAMAGAIGVSTQTAYAVGLAVSAGLAAFGGVIAAELLPIEPFYAFRHIITFLVVVSVGGAGTIFGALMACLVLGAVDTTGRYFLPDFGNFIFYAAVIVIVLAYPDGFFRKLR